MILSVKTWSQLPAFFYYIISDCHVVFTSFAFLVLGCRTSGQEVDYKEEVLNVENGDKWF